MNLSEFSKKISNFTVNRIIEVLGLLIITISLFLFFSLLSYSPNDPNLVFSSETEIKNLFGFYGSFASDLFFQSFGIISFLFCVTIFLNGILVIKNKKLNFIIKNLFFSIIYIIIGCLFFSLFYEHSYSLVINGNGGFIGNYLKDVLTIFIESYKEKIIFPFLLIFIILFFLLSINFKIKSLLTFLNILKKIIKKPFLKKEDTHEELENGNLVKENIDKSEQNEIKQANLPFNENN